MSELPPGTGILLGNTVEDISGTAWLLGHDLKSPLAIVISTLEMLLALHEDEEEMAGTMQLVRGALGAANREYNMISDMLDLARLETNQYQLEREETDLVWLLRECLDDENYNLKGKNLVLKINLPDTPIYAEVEPDLFRRVFGALLDNTIKFTVKNDTLEVIIRQAGGNVELSFSDTGRAIFSDFEQEIVRRAPQWDKRQAGSRTSVGMGLPFANAVLKAHGGQFRCKSENGRTTFSLSIPVLKPANS